MKTDILFKPADPIYVIVNAQITLKGVIVEYANVDCC